MGDSSRIVIVGGSSKGLEEGCLASCEYGSNTEDDFVFKSDVIPDLGEGGRSPAVYSCFSTVFVAGGCVEQGSHSSSIRKLKIADNDGWETCSEKLSRGVSCAAYCQFKDKSLFLAGGYDGLECLNDVYLIKTNRESGVLVVSSLSPLQSRCKNGAALVVRDDENVKQVLIFGGWDEHRTLSCIFEYTIHENYGECTMATIMPIALEGHTVTRIPNHEVFDAIISGGFDGINVVGSFYAYKISSKKMTILSNVAIAIPRENHVAFRVTYDEKMCLAVAGGWDGKSALKSCELFEILPEAPFLIRIREHKLQLNVPRNRPGIAILQ